MSEKNLFEKNVVKYMLGKLKGVIEESAFSGNYSDLTGVPENLTDFTNDAGFVTDTVANLVNYYAKSETFTKDEITGLINAVKADVEKSHISVVDALPETGDFNIIYLVPKAGGKTKNIKTEYIWTGTDFEIIGDTEIDLANYITKDMAVGYDDILTRAEAGNTYVKDADFVAITAEEIDAMFDEVFAVN